MTFRVGEQVVCVDASPTSYGGRRDLHDGAVYTIRKNGRLSDCRWHRPAPDGPAVWLCEFARTPCPETGIADLPFRADRFRPLIERKTETGVAILKQIARDVTERKPVKISE
jgi:hypothetical protein